MKKTLALLLAVLVFASVLSGCSGSAPAPAAATPAPAAPEVKEPLVMVWYPNESGEDMKPAREEIAKLFTEATGREVEHKTTTDYVIAIEAIASGNADIGFFGAQGYIEANIKNAKVQPLVVNSGASGTLSDAMYYSWLAVNLGNEGPYKSGDKFAIDNIEGKRFSFVSSSSTSGFKVPSAGIASYFAKTEKWKSLKAEDLVEGGKGKFFSEVLFGGSHQGSAVNLITGKVDVAAFCDTCVFNYVELVSGTGNRPGAIYKVRADAAEPFDKLPGKEFILISVTPVLNAPFVINTDTVTAEEAAALKKAMTSDDAASNPQIFVPKDSQFKGLFAAPQRFVEVDDAWFNPIRELSN